MEFLLYCWSCCPSSVNHFRPNSNQELLFHLGGVCLGKYLTLFLVDRIAWLLVVSLHRVEFPRAERSPYHPNFSRMVPFTYGMLSLQTFFSRWHSLQIIHSQISASGVKQHARRTSETRMMPASPPLPPIVGRPHWSLWEEIFPTSMHHKVYYDFCEVLETQSLVLTKAWSPKCFVRFRKPSLCAASPQTLLTASSIT